ncbi:type II toxin-antitoxin system RelE/ParE family toxin [Desulfobacter vibrioformis]|uniref:type II toxin-antitoxin system RelE/ParE family toxin n=1 Tax=Desulfobacter vibrioformis TaxID=34031 RepID=UPI000551B619|nr:type II toxin-antitoxin system RelE/ParE family toxin [Desulfobacter vibrioformis]
MNDKQIKLIVWVGSSLEQLKKFPDTVKDEIGFALHRALEGKKHHKAKPLKGFDGVFEIVSSYRTDTYRAVYILKLGNNIYVLHAFQKKSKSGIKTPKKEIEMIKKRLQQALELAKEKPNE